MTVLGTQEVLLNSGALGREHNHPQLAASCSPPTAWGFLFSNSVIYEHWAGDKKDELSTPDFNSKSLLTKDTAGLYCWQRRCWLKNKPRKAAFLTAPGPDASPGVCFVV